MRILIHIATLVRRALAEVCTVPVPLVNDDFLADLLLHVMVKEFSKLVGIWQSYEREYNGIFLTEWLTKLFAQLCICRGVDNAREILLNSVICVLCQLLLS